MRTRVFLTPNMLLVFVWARLKPAHMASWHLKSSTGYGVPCNTCTDILGSWEMNCADHAAALKALGLVSSHDLSFPWARHNFDIAACFGSCNNIGDVLEKLHDIRTEMTSIPQKGRWRSVSHRILCCSHACISSPFTHALHRMWLSFIFSLAQPFTVPGCTLPVSWKAQLCVSLPPRALMNDSHTTCGIP